MPWPVVVSLAEPCRTNCPVQPSKITWEQIKAFCCLNLASRQPGRFLNTDKCKPKEGKLSLPLHSPYLRSQSSALQLASCADRHALSWVWLQQHDENRQGELGCFRADSPQGSWQDGRNAPALRTYFQQLCLLSLVFQCQQWAVSHPQRLMCTEGKLLAEDKMAQNIDSKTTALQERRQKKREQETEENRKKKTAQLQKWFSSINHQRSTITRV